MIVKTTEREINTRGPGDTHDLTSEVRKIVVEAGVTDGVATIFVVGSTAGVTTLEYETGVIADLDATFERLAPRQADYQHHLRWHDDNGSSHVRAALLGPSVTVPIRRGELTLGQWQQIVLIEFDTRPRTRRYVVQLLGA